MKAVVVEIRGKEVAALDASGVFHKIKNRSYVIGQTIDIQEVKTKHVSYKKLVAVAAAAMVLLVGGNYAFGTLDIHEDSQAELNTADSTKAGNVSDESYDQIKSDVKDGIQEQVEQNKENWEENGDQWRDVIDEFNEWGRKVTEEILDKLKK